MENNGLVLGRIPVSAPGCKTYPESFFVEFGYDASFNCSTTYYLNKQNRISSFCRKDEGKELVILSILPYGGINSYNSLRFNYIVEFIEKDILYQHLIDERMIIEEQLKNGNNSLSLTK